MVDIDGAAVMEGFCEEREREVVWMVRVMVLMTRNSSGTQGFSFAQVLNSLQQDAESVLFVSVTFEMKHHSSLLQQLRGRPISSPVVEVSSWEEREGGMLMPT